MSSKTYHRDLELVQACGYCDPIAKSLRRGQPKPQGRGGKLQPEGSTAPASRKVAGQFSWWKYLRKLNCVLWKGTALKCTRVTEHHVSKEKISHISFPSSYFFLSFLLPPHFCHLATGSKTNSVTMREEGGKISFPLFGFCMLSVSKVWLLPGTDIFNYLTEIWAVYVISVT